MSSVKVKNGPTIFELEEVVIGSKLAFALYLEQETNVPDVYEPVDFTNKIVKVHVKDNVRNDIEPDAVITPTPRVADPGWCDFLMDGSATGTGGLSERDYEASVKVEPSGSPELGVTLAVIKMPVKYRATR